MPTPPATSQRTTLLSVALVALALLAYANVLAKAGWIWDDDLHVTQNATLTQPDGLAHIWLQRGATPQYYPLVFTTFWIEHQLWGDHAHGYHLVNVLLHAASACLLWVILRRAKLPGGQVTAWLTAALFAIHPLQVESVAWITELKNVQSGFFCLAALWAYLNFAQWDPANEERIGSPAFWYLASLLLFVAALLSKTVACSLPVAILLLEWWKLGRITIRTLFLVVPMLVLGAAAGLYTVYLENMDIIKVHAARDEWDIPWIERFMIAGRALVFYAQKLVCPTNLTFSYERWTLNRHAYAGWAYLAAVVGTLIALLSLHRRIGRGPLAAVLFFIVTLFPALGFFNVYPMRYSFVADHFQYMACIGLFLIIAAALTKLLTFLEESDRWIGQLALVPLLIALGVMTFRQSRIYVDQETLWRDTTVKNPSSWLAWENLGDELHIRAQTTNQEVRDTANREAIDALKKALALREDATNAYNSLGQIYAEQNNWEDASDAYGNGLAIDPDHVMLLVSYANLKNIQGQFKKSQRLAQHAVDLAPNYAFAHTALGTALEDQGSLTDAEDHFRRALQLAPHNAWILNALGGLLLAEHKDDEALGLLRQAVALQPRFAQAQNNLGLDLGRSGVKSQVEEAVVHFRAALQELPAFHEARYNLARTLHQLGESEAAITEYRILIRAKPDALMCAELAELLSTIGDTRVRDLQEAIVLARKACDMTENRDVTMLRMLGQILAEDERYDEAISALRHAMHVAATQPNPKPQIEAIDQQIEEYHKTLIEKSGFQTSK